jgi:7-alpha-hydroxysteroid dehydrogenase
VVADEPGDEVRALDAAADRFGRLTLLVNVVGGAPARHVTETDDAELRRALELNLELPLRLSRAAVPHLRASGGGAIVNISSAMAHLAAPGFVVYGSAKAGLEHATRLLAADLAPDIRVNAVSPGAVMTTALARFVAARGGAEDALERVPLGRLAEPEDVAHAVRFLCSPAAAYVTGVVLPVEGGIQVPVFGFR